MGMWEKHEFERACRYGDDEQIREAARNLWDREPTHGRRETADFIAKTLKRNKVGAREFNGDVAYDGVTVRKGFYPRLYIDGMEER